MHTSIDSPFREEYVPSWVFIKLCIHDLLYLENNHLGLWARVCVLNRETAVCRKTREEITLANNSTTLNISAKERQALLLHESLDQNT